MANILTFMTWLIGGLLVAKIVWTAVVVHAVAFRPRALGRGVASGRSGVSLMAAAEPLLLLLLMAVLLVQEEPQRSIDPTTALLAGLLATCLPYGALWAIIVYRRRRAAKK